MRSSRLLLAPDGPAPVALAVAADPSAGASLEALATSLGHGCVRAATIAEVQFRITEGAFGYALVEMDAPTHDGAFRFAALCDPAIAFLWSASARTGRIVPIFAIGAPDEDGERVSDMHQLGIDAFIIRRLGDHGAGMRSRIRMFLFSAHQSAAPPPPSPVLPSERPSPPLYAEGDAATNVHVRIAGGFGGKHGAVLIDGTPCELAARTFGVLVQLIDARLSSPGGRISLKGPGQAGTCKAASRIRGAFRDLLPPDFEFVVSDHHGHVGLGAGVVIDGVEWALLTNHPEAKVRLIAANRLRLGACTARGRSAPSTDHAA